jgi:hypothetical protein
VFAAEIESYLTNILLEDLLQANLKYTSHAGDG